MKVKIEIELDCDYSNCHFTEERMMEILFEYPQKIKDQINSHTGSLYFNGMSMAAINAKSARITSYSEK